MLEMGLGWPAKGVARGVARGRTGVYFGRLDGLDCGLRFVGRLSRCVAGSDCGGTCKFVVMLTTRLEQTSHAAC